MLSESRSDTRDHTRCPDTLLRSSQAATICPRSSLLARLQAQISAMLRKQPRQTSSSFSVHNRMQGDATGSFASQSVVIVGMLEFRVITEVDNRIIDLLQHACFVFAENTFQDQVI